jgi:FtsZ-binding cell division protein ZapB
MSKVSRKSLIATTIIGALTFASSQYAAADTLTNLQSAEAKIFKASKKSQTKINSIYEQTQELIAEYRNVVDQADVLKGYNDHVQRLVNGQKENIQSLQDQIDSIDKIKQGVVPLMYKMIDTLEKFVSLDIPVKLESRKERIAQLREVMTNPNVTTSEQFRLVLEAYEIEAGYGTTFEADQGELNLGDRTITADFVNMGRIAYLAESLDLKHAWVWNNQTRAWEELGEEYLKPVTDTIRMARKQLPMDLTKLPVFAAGAK